MLIQSILDDLIIIIIVIITRFHFLYFLLFVLDAHVGPGKSDRAIAVNISGPDVVRISTQARVLALGHYVEPGFAPLLPHAVFQVYINARTLDLPALPLALEFYLFIGVSALAHTMPLQVDEVTSVHLAVRHNLCSFADVAPLPRALDNCPIVIPVHFPIPVRNQGLKFAGIRIATRVGDGALGDLAVFPITLDNVTVNLRKFSFSVLNHSFVRNFRCLVLFTLILFLLSSRFRGLRSGRDLFDVACVNGAIF